MPEDRTLAPLPPDALRAAFDPTTLPVPETAGSGRGLLGQDRATDAIRMAARLRHSDYNLFVLGPAGSGRRESVRTLLGEARSSRPTPSDWVYVNNFDAPDAPIAIELPPGHAVAFRSAMQGLIDELANAIPAIFESEDYQTRRRAIEQSHTERHEAAMGALFERAKAREIVILRTPMGFMVAASRDGEVLTPDQFKALPDATQAEIQTAIEETEAELETVLKAVPTLQKDQRREVEELNQSMAAEGVDDSIAELTARFGAIPAITVHLERVRRALIEHAEIFLVSEDSARAGAFPVATTQHFEKRRFQEFAVNVIVSHDDTDQCGAPLIEEDLPTLSNLIGRIEYASEQGALVTNFTMLKPGALHQANGGFLVLDARQVLQEPFAWDALKRCLKTGRISIFSPGERLSLISTASLKPDAIPLDLRVVLIGERFLYYLLMALDPDFPTLFKIEADFSDEIARAPEVLAGYTQMLGRIVDAHALPPLDPSATAEILLEATRMAEDGERLSLNVGRLTDTLREAAFWAAEAGRETIGAAEVTQAITERERRSSRIRDLSQEQIHRETILIDTEGRAVGQINALSVVGLGDYRFGRPTRLTARTRLGSGKVVDIERETDLGGPIHSKGVLILQGYLSTTYATDLPMSLWASLVFEQSYGGVDGDSASAAELIALLSSLAALPIDQSLAITGSVNQFGAIQAIGGVNEKIEGFFDVCAARGLTGRQGLVIPASNVKNLALRQRVVDAVAAGRFQIFPVQTISEALQLLLGHAPGDRGPDGRWPETSIHGRVEAKLRAYAAARRAFAAEKTDAPS